ncbi:MAG: RNA polymerase sigma-70 factor [Mariniphaga sp.]|nr:RNA polymerase sigma-70 factor [Mariniphaga sp.]
MFPNSANSFNEIYKAFYKKSVLFVRSYIHDGMAAEDIVTETLISLWERMKRDTVDPIPPFLFTLLKNRSLDYLKHQAIKRVAYDVITQTLNRELEIRTTTLEACDPATIFAIEIQQIFQSTLNSLPEKTREIFMMSRFGNKSHKEIAELFGISVKGVDYHILQSINELRITLKDYLPFLGALIFLK